MKKYEAPKLEISVLCSEDVIRTSEQVTTENINVPWGGEESLYETN